MKVKIGKCTVSTEDPVFIVAELSCNHLQNKETALAVVEAAAAAGADALKLQTYTPDTITIDSRNEEFRINQGTLWDGQTLYDLYREAYLPWEWHGDIWRKAIELGLECFSSPFDHSAVDFLETFDPPAYKIASFEINDLPLIEKVALTGRPVILSTGVATEQEIRIALETCKRLGNDQVILLKCTSSYPAPPEEMNLAMIPDMRNRFSVLTGLSDHTVGIEIPVAAVALGAVVIEKHLTLDRSLGGPDSAFSLEPGEFKSMVDAVRTVEKAIGTVSYDVSERVRPSRHFMRSLYVVEDIRSGEKFTPQNVRSIRPSKGLSPALFNRVIGKRAKRDIESGTPLSREDIEEFSDEE